MHTYIHTVQMGPKVLIPFVFIVLAFPSTYFRVLYATGLIYRSCLRHLLS